MGGREDNGLLGECAQTGARQSTPCAISVWPNWIITLMTSNRPGAVLTGPSWIKRRRC